MLDEEYVVKRILNCFKEALGRMPATFHDWYTVADHYGFVLAEVDTPLPFSAAYIGELICVPLLPPDESFGVIASALTHALLRHPDYACELNVDPILHHHLAALVVQRVVEAHSIEE